MGINRNQTWDTPITTIDDNTSLTLNEIPSGRRDNGDVEENSGERCSNSGFSLQNSGNLQNDDDDHEEMKCTDVEDVAIQERRQGGEVNVQGLDLRRVTSDGTA